MTKKDILPITLTSAGCISTALSTYLGIKAGIKISELLSEEEPDKKEIAKACLPAGISCVTAIGFDVAAGVINHKQKNDILSLLAIAGSSYVGYRQEVIRRYGEEVDREIAQTVNPNPYVCCMCPDIPDKLSHWIIDMCDENLPVYEIDAYERDIINAEKHLNRNYILMTCQTYSDFLEFLGIKTRDKDTENYGWCIDDNEIYYIDFQHEEIEPGVFRIFPMFSPWYDCQNLNMFGEPY